MIEAHFEGRNPYSYENYNIHQETASFALKYITAHPEKASDKHMMSFFSDLNRGAFWAVLSTLDGPAKGDLDPRQDHPSFPDRTYEAERKKARKWTAENFSKYELSQVFKLTLTLALDSKDAAKSAWPGKMRGHSTLLRHLVDKPDSIFKGELGEKGRRSLVNGAFWEELGEATMPEYLEDLLLDHSSDLDATQARQGMELYKRNRNHGRMEIDMRLFNVGALDEYLGFIKKIDSLEGDDGLKPSDVDKLLSPYISAIFQPDFEDPYALRFGPKYDLEASTVTSPLIDYKERLNDPLIKKSLSRSTKNIQEIATSVSVMMDQMSVDLALDIVETIGGVAGEEILQRVIEDKEIRYNNTELKLLLSESNSPLAKKAAESLNSPRRI